MDETGRRKWHPEERETPFRSIDSPHRFQSAQCSTSKWKSKSHHSSIYCSAHTEFRWIKAQSSSSPESPSKALRLENFTKLCANVHSIQLSFYLITCRTRYFQWWHYHYQVSPQLIKSIFGSTTLVSINCGAIKGKRTRSRWRLTFNQFKSVRGDQLSH